MMRLLLEISWEMWEDRNEFLHKADHPWNLQEEQQINIEISEAYENFNKEKYLRRDLNLFASSVSHKLGLSRVKKKNWLQSVFAASFRKRKFKK